VREQVCARRLGAVRVRGKQHPTQVYELRHLGPPTPREAEAVEAGLDAFTARDFDQAERQFQSVLRLWTHDGPTRRYGEELTFLKLSPPGPEWDAASAGVVK
jgi:adenylate cyclase